MPIPVILYMVVGVGGGGQAGPLTATDLSLSLQKPSHLLILDICFLCFVNGP